MLFRNNVFFHTPLPTRPYTYRYKRYVLKAMQVYTMQLLLFFERPKVALLAREIFGKNIIITEHTCICIFIIC